MIIISMIISIILIIGTYLINKKSNIYEKRTTIESGFESIDEKLEKQVHYYLPFYIVGIIFIIFDLEVVLLYPFISLFSHIFFYNYYDTLPFDWNTSYYLIYIVYISFLIFIVYGLYLEYKNNLI